MKNNNNNEGITILGAGAIGCYLAGCFYAEGIPVRMLGRHWFQNEIARYGMTIVHHDGQRQSFAMNRLDYQTDTSCLSGSKLIIVCVKNTDLYTAIQQIQTYAPDATVISLLNGLSSVEILRKELSQAQVIGGSVAYGVNYLGEGEFKKTTEGCLHLEASTTLKLWLPSLDRAFGKSRLHDDIQAVLWTKLLLNLNNSINALSGLPLKDQMRHRKYRKQWADCIREGLNVMEGYGIQPVDIGTRIPLEKMPYVLELPNLLFRLIAARSLRIDARARMSMWSDIKRGKVTEVDELNGKVVMLAEQLGMEAVTNQKIYDQIKGLESQKKAE
ncbi:2-dehydropantoate 2-reductase [Endozoicomonas sp. OPT23]|uniref:2-dehydropantoate 2-reductase n=1 Tax=Endozoicomonas sp. OPT23 TaxID=2072845 RepID=UPI00129AFEBF|nr:2-dehydropantoate 2-reductase [Endozoicomonas sp. OPT23]MRI33533.1 2-dehydropantoate 2-reductase [Endozoicomonas sp. OPT23]